ncbi:MAG: septum formation initiator family protein [Paracoccaceae bacterium]
MRTVDPAQFAAPLVYATVLAIVAVFLHSALQSDRGLGALAEAEAREIELTRTLAALRDEREAFETKVDRLGDGYLDLDLLEEEARRGLGLVRPDEVIIRPVAP